jgi:hypothetical protein
MSYHVFIKYAFCGADIIDVELVVHSFVVYVDSLFLPSSFEVVYVDAFAWVLSALAITAYALAFATHLSVHLTAAHLDAGVAADVVSD